MARLLLPAGAMGGWLALPAVLLLGPRSNRYRKDGAISAHPPSNIPFLALGAWILTVGGSAGVFGQPALGGLGHVSLAAQFAGTLLGVAWASLSGLAVYGTLKALMGLRLSPEEEHQGADLAIHRIGSTPEREATW